MQIDFQKCCEKIAGSLNEFCNRWCKREHVECDALKDWKLNIFKIIDRRISFYSQNTIISYRYLKSGIEEFHRKYVLVPADKAANNGGWSGGAKVLGKLPVPGRPTILITVGQGPTALAVGAGGGCLDIFTLIYIFSSLSPSLWETARYRLKYCLKGPLNPKQPTNQLQTTWLLFDGCTTLIL